MADKKQELEIITEIWKKTVAALENKLPAATYTTFIKKSYPLSISGKKIKIALISEMAKTLIEDRFAKEIKSVFSSFYSGNLTIAFEVVEEKKENNQKKTDPKKPQKKTKKQYYNSFEYTSNPLNVRHNFSNFVVGKTNRFAYTVASSVATSDLGSIYNPLFIYGGPGLGKTHLLNAIGNTVAKNDPEKRIIYIKGEEFTRQFINAIAEHKIDEFKRKYKNVDLWLMDDIQFLVGKERTEEEFLNTYNNIFENGKQIVLASDRPVKELNFNERTISRFRQGMMASVDPPDFETRMAILKSKFKDENIYLKPDILMYLAKLKTKDVRQLEGIIVRLHAYISIEAEDITIDIAQQLTQDYVENQEETYELTIDHIVKYVADFFSINKSDIIGKSRSRNIVVPRQIAMYLIYEILKIPLKTIGIAFGGKDHTTVLHSCQKIEEMIKNDEKTAETISEIRENITCGKNVDTFG